MVDYSHITGGCSFPCECQNFTSSSCENCPAIKPFLRNYIKKLFISKKHYLQNLPSTYITGSKISIEKLSLSPISKGKKIHYLPGLGGIIFKDIKTPPKRFRNEIKRKIDIEENSFIITFAADSINNPRKGFEYLVESLKFLPRESRYLICLLFIGSIEEKDLIKIPKDIKTRHVPFLNNFKDLNHYLSISDLFISLSIDDMGPAMLIIAMLQSIPILSFSVGIANDFLKHKSNSYVADFCSPVSIADGIRFYLNLNKVEINLHKKNSRKSVLKIFSDRYQKEIHKELMTLL